MKPSLLSASLLSLAHALIRPIHAGIAIPGADGSDGALNITQDSVIDSSKATTGKWDDNNSANAGNGVYDPEKWAVVFKYTSVNVLAGKKLTFKNHATRAPVVWLVSGNVTIGGTVDLAAPPGATRRFFRMVVRNRWAWTMVPPGCRPIGRKRGNTIGRGKCLRCRVIVGII